ncbi:MAG: glucose 1-dehydrogenase [Nitrospiraceae bacterium]
MKALAVFPSDRKVRLIEQAQPGPPGSDQVMLRIREVGICGTDREICAFEYGAPPAGSDRLIIGHESLAEVVEVGADVIDVRPGDLVVPMVRRPCIHPKCLACRAGRQDFCVSGDFQERGIQHADGFLTEFVIEEEPYVIPVPPALADVAVLVEPLTVVAKAALQMRDIQQRLPYEVRHGRGVVLGAGPVGLLGAMTLVARGYETFVYSREPSGGEREALIRSFGATYLSARDHAIGKIGAHIGNIDIMFEATGVSALAFAALEALGVNGVFIITGVPGRKLPTEVDTDLIMRNLVLRNQLLFGTVNAGRSAYEAAIQQLEQFMTLFPASVRGLITGRSPLEGAQDLIARRDGIKDVVQVSSRAA